jgi:hypothetical protein
MRAIERWHVFLEQIAGRHRAISEEAQVAAATVLEAAGFDPTPIATAWTAVENRLVELERRIVVTWHEKVDRAFEEEGADAARRIAAFDRGDDLRFVLENAREELQHRVYAAAARRMHAHALAMRAQRVCVRCGAEWPIPVTYRAIDVRCAHCGTLAAFEPGALLRQFATFGAHALASEAARDAWRAMRVSERAVHKMRPPHSLPLLKAHERAQIAYWRTYLDARSRVEPALRTDLGHEVRSRMEAWYRDRAEFEPEWVRAGRPRDVI